VFCELIRVPSPAVVAAPADGKVEHYDNQLGGLSYRLHGDDGTCYCGTHLFADRLSRRPIDAAG
jgi:hypothetical protein